MPTTDAVRRVRPEVHGCLSLIGRHRQALAHLWRRKRSRRRIEAKHRSKIQKLEHRLRQLTRKDD